VVEALAHTLPVFAELPNVAPHADFRLAGQRVPRQPHRYSGRTAMLAHRTVHEPKPPDDPDTPLAFSMEGYERQPPPPLIPFFWAPGWNSPQAINKFQNEVGGALRGGDPGLRLFEPVADGSVAFFQKSPEAFSARDDALLLVPLYHIFGSEELSVLAPAVAERVPAPYIALSQADAAALQVEPGDIVACTLVSTTQRLPVQIEPSLPRGIAGLPVGLPAIPWMALPAWGTLTKVGQS
jgi:NADH-quinone oxidoreductase subunit G